MLRVLTEETERADAMRKRAEQMERKAGRFAARATGLQERLHEAQGRVETVRRMCADRRPYEEIDDQLAGIAKALAILPTSAEDPEQPQRQPGSIRAS